MNKQKRYINIALALLATGMLQAQEKNALNMRLHADQKVYITGEDIWIDGETIGTETNSKSVTVRLLDRNGSVKREVDVQNSNNGFAAILSVPENLVSDYYFLDCLMKGVQSVTQLAPVLVINPKAPPSNTCNFRPQVPEVNVQPNNRISIKTGKATYKDRENVDIHVEGLNLLNSISVTVDRYDRLSSLLDSVTATYNATLQHSGTGQMENEGHVVTAMVSENGKPAQGIQIVAGIKGSRAAIAAGQTDANGITTMIIPISYNSNQLLLSPRSGKDKSLTVKVLQDMDMGTPISFPCLKLDESMRDDINARIFNRGVTASYHGESIRLYEIPERDSTDFYGKPDSRYILDEYVRFPVLEEVITEIMPDLRLRKNDGEQTLQVLNLPTRSFFNNAPLVLVDGIPVRSTKEILEIDPLTIRCIDLITRRYMMNDTEFEGVVHFKTYKPERSNLKTASSDLIAPFKSLQEKASLQSPDLSGNQDRLPDHRNILYRELDLKADASGKADIRLQSSDAEGSYRITVRALTPGKQVVRAEAIFNISGK